jgi:hypothetical protein
MLLYMRYNIFSIRFMFYFLFMVARSTLILYKNIIIDYYSEAFTYIRIGKVPQRLYQNSKEVINGCRNIWEFPK